MDYWGLTATTKYFLDNINLQRDQVLQPVQLSLNQLCQRGTMDSTDVIGMLYMSGYLTLKGYDGTEVMLGIPNSYVRTTINNILIGKIFPDTKSSEFSAFEKHSRGLVDELKKTSFEDVSKLEDDLFGLLNSVTYHQISNEAVVQTILSIAFNIAKCDYTMEEATVHGRSDFVLKFDNRVIVIEVKNDAKGSKPPAKWMETALAQIDNKKYYIKYTNKPTRELYAVGLFAGKNPDNNDAYFGQIRGAKYNYASKKLEDIDIVTPSETT